MLLASLGTSVANVALPTLAREFAAPFQYVQWVVLAYLLASTALVVGVGRLGDVIGRRRLLLGGVSLFTAASLACGSAPTLGLLIAARAAQGLGAAILLSQPLALVTAAVPEARTGRAMGLLGTLSALGTALGPSLGGALIAAFGWRSVFFVNLPLGLLTLALARRGLPPERPDSTVARPAFDALGALLLALSLGAYALALTIGRGRLGALNLALLLGAALGAGLFVAAEARAEAPLIRWAMLRAPALATGLALGALVSTVVMATLVVGPFYLSLALGLDAARVGLVMSAGPLVAALTGVPAGRGVDRFGAQRVTVLGLAVAALGAAALALTPPALGIVGYVAPVVLITAGYALFQAANNTALMRGVDPGARGVISGLLTLSRNLGLITGASVMGAVFAFAAGARELTEASPAEVAFGLRATFAVAAALLVLALAVAVAVGARASTRRAAPRLGGRSWS